MMSSHVIIPLLPLEGCYKDDEQMLPQRLLDWFHILKSEELKKNGGTLDETEIKTSGRYFSSW